MHFLDLSIDWLTVNLFRPRDVQRGHSGLYAFFELLFAIPHNDTNASLYHNQSFYGSEVKFDIQFLPKMRQGCAVQFLYLGEPVIMLTKIEALGGMSNLTDYEFRVDFYGMFFGLQRCGVFDGWPILVEFLNELRVGKFSWSFSRLDIALDLAGVTPRDLFGGFKSGRDISHTFINSTFKGGAETVYIGKRTNPKFVRIYDKKADCKAKGKERWYLDYMRYDRVSRVEVVLRSEVLKTVAVVPWKLLDRANLWSLMRSCLNDKQTKYELVEHVDRHFAEEGYLEGSLVRSPRLNCGDRLPFVSVVRRFFRLADSIKAVYGVEPLEVLRNRGKYNGDGVRF